MVEEGEKHHLEGRNKTCVLYIVMKKVGKDEEVKEPLRGRKGGKRDRFQKTVTSAKLRRNSLKERQKLIKTDRCAKIHQCLA